MKEFKVTVYVMTPYSTIVEAKTEEEAIELALERDAPAIPAFMDEAMLYEWASEDLIEFPNLGKDELPEVEEI